MCFHVQKGSQTPTHQLLVWLGPGVLLHSRGTTAAAAQASITRWPSSPWPPPATPRRCCRGSGHPPGQRLSS